MSLKELRNSIDSIDIQLQELIQQRAALGKKIAAVKREQEDHPNFVVFEREAQVLENVRKRNQGDVSPASMVRIFQEIISITRALEERLRIAILGPEGTFTHDAALQQFGREFEAVFRPTIPDVFYSVAAGRAKFGVVPVENSNQGIVDSTLDCLLDSSLRLCGEIELTIHHALLSNAADLADVELVLAHEQALAQCRKWLSLNMPDARLQPVSSNAEAIVEARKSDSMGAIASEAAAKLYRINVLRSNIEDFVANATRFLVIGDVDVGPSGQDKTSILMSKQSEPGSLLKLLEPFARHGINMTMIESHPSQKGNWEYVFFVDFDGHAEDPPVVALFEELREEAPLLKLLGSYPKCAN